MYIQYIFRCVWSPDSAAEISPTIGDQRLERLFDAAVSGRDEVLRRRNLVLYAHEDNPEIVKQWEAWRSLLPDSAMAPPLPASEIVNTEQRGGYSDWTGARVLSIG